jgi:hypothetical protein
MSNSGAKMLRHLKIHLSSVAISAFCTYLHVPLLNFTRLTIFTFLDTIRHFAGCTKHFLFADEKHFKDESSTALNV